MIYYKAGLLKRVAQHIKSGGVIAYPTESCFGLGCSAQNYKAIKQILKLKQRSKTKGLIVIAGKFAQLEGLVEPFNNQQLHYINQYWPGPYSFIVKVKPRLPRNLTGKHDKLAVRVTAHQQVKQLCGFLDMALVSTSANKSGLQAIKGYRECIRQFGKQVMVLPGTTLGAKKPSTIIDLKTRRILR